MPEQAPSDSPWGWHDSKPPLSRRPVQIAVATEQYYPTPLSEGTITAHRVYALANDGSVWAFMPEPELGKSPGFWLRFPDLPQD